MYDVCIVIIMFKVAALFSVDDLGMTIPNTRVPGRDEGWKWDQSLFCISSQQSLHICRVASDFSAVMNIYGWIYRTKIDPISFLHPYPCFLNFLSNGHPYIFFHFTEIFFPH